MDVILKDGTWGAPDRPRRATAQAFQGPPRANDLFGATRVRQGATPETFVRQRDGNVPRPYPLRFIGIPPKLPLELRDDLRLAVAGPGAKDWRRAIVGNSGFRTRLVSRTAGQLRCCVSAGRFWEPYPHPKANAARTWRRPRPKPCPLVSERFCRDISRG